MLKTSKCPNCNASNIKIKKQGHLKFFQVPLSKKYITINLGKKIK